MDQFKESVAAINELLEGIPERSPGRKIKDDYSFVGMGGLEAIVESLHKFVGQWYGQVRDSHLGSLASDFVYALIDFQKQFGELSSVSLQELTDYLFPRDLLPHLDERLKEVKLPKETGSKQVAVYVATSIHAAEKLLEGEWSQDALASIVNMELATYIALRPEYAVLNSTLTNMINRDDMRSDQLKHRERHDAWQITRENYEETRDSLTPLYRETLLLVDSLSFDLRNLVLDDFTNAQISALVNTHTNKGPPYRGFPLRGMAAAMTQPRVFRKLKEAKEAYLKSRRPIREQQAEMPNAIGIYLENQLRYVQNVSGVEAVFNIVRQAEFEVFQKAQRYRDYIAFVLNGSDMTSRLQKPWKQMAEHVKDHVAQTYYISVFYDDPVWALSHIDTLTSPGFVDLWTHAAKYGWVDQIGERLYDILPLIELEDVFDDLMHQESGSLVQLFRSKGFQKRYLNGFHLPDYSPFNQLLQVDEELFENVITTLTPQDTKSAVQLARLAATQKLHIQNFGTAERNFLTTLPDYTAEDGEAVSFALMHAVELDRLQRTRVVPSEIDDPIKLSHWIDENHDQAIKDLSTHDALIRYTGESHRESLMDSLRALHRTHGLGIIEMVYNDFHTNPLGYQRAISLLKVLAHPKEIIRHREDKAKLRQLAETLEPEQWASFADDLSTSHAMPSEVLKKYSPKGRSDPFGQAYRANQGTDRQRVFETVIDLRDSRADRPMLGALEQLLVDGHDRVVDYAIQLLSQGSTVKARSFLQLYKTDADMTTPPHEFGLGLDEIPPPIPPSPTPQEFDKTEFVQFVEGEGYAPTVVQIAIVDAFKLDSSGKFIGMNYLPYHHVALRVRTRSGYDPRAEQQTDDVLRWLVAQKVLIHHERKGRRVENGCLSINPHIKDITAAPLRQFMEYVLYRQTPHNS